MVKVQKLSKALFSHTHTLCHHSSAMTPVVIFFFFNGVTSADLPLLRLHGDLVSFSAGDGRFHKLMHWIRDKAFLLDVKGSRRRLHPLPLRLPQIRGRGAEHGHLCVPHGRAEADRSKKCSYQPCVSIIFQLKCPHFSKKLKIKLYRGLDSGALQREKSA